MRPLLLRSIFFVPWQAGSANGSHFGFQLGHSFQKAYLEEWVHVVAVPSEDPSSADQGKVIPKTPKVSMIAPTLPLESADPVEKANFWERTETTASVADTI